MRKPLPALLLVFSLSSAGVAAAQGGQADGDPTFVRQFGEIGERGSFRAKFDTRGAGLVWLQLTDHVTDDARARHVDRKPPSERADGDHLLLVTSTGWAGGGDYSFRLIADGANPFGGALQTVPWEHRFPDAGSVEFTLAKDGLALVKTFRHRPGKRGFAIELAVRNTGGVAVAAPAFAASLTGPSLVNSAETTLFGNPAFAFVHVPDANPVVVRPERPDDGAAKVPLLDNAAPWSAAGSTNRFFGAFLFPLDDGANTALRGVAVSVGPATGDETTQTKPFTVPRTHYALELKVPAAGEAETKVTLGLYLGPKSYRVFDEDAEHARFEPVMDIDLDTPCCGATMPGGRFMASLLLKLLAFFESIAGNWGVAIMMLTVLVRGLLAPLNFRMQKSMRAYGAKMAVLKPKLDKINKDFADDPKGKQQAMIAFQREHKLIPPLGGCLPIFLTMPIYFGLFTALRVAYDLRHQPLAGWIDDLSRPDALFVLGLDLGLFELRYFNLLPLLWLALFLIMQLRMPLPTDPQQRQIQQIMRLMPLVFGVVLYNYASGLMVYMVTSMLWTFAESAIVKRILGPIDPNVQAMTPTPI